MAGCAQCGGALAIVGGRVGRRDICPSCGSDLHSCRQCRHFDMTVAKECKEPLAEVPADKEDANFCDFFQIGEGGVAAQQSHKAQIDLAESLFRKK